MLIPGSGSASACRNGGSCLPSPSPPALVRVGREWEMGGVKAQLCNLRACWEEVPLGSEAKSLTLLASLPGKGRGRIPLQRGDVSFPAAPKQGLGLCLPALAPGTIWEPPVWQAEQPGMCVHKDQECLFFLVDSLWAERGSSGRCLPSGCDKKPSP